jgi:ring-1,2-phenylacetyl-CoA epoxidase subunit PaaD
VVTTTTLEQSVREALATVMDPEIPVCSIADLGLIERVCVKDDAIEVTLLPTFVGCPALEMILADAAAAVRAIAGGREVRVGYALDPPWTTDRISDAGREALRGFGIAPPGEPRPLQIRVRCPNCGSLETTLDAEFGPTPCRTIRFCNSCRNPFEGFKPKGA